MSWVAVNIERHRLNHNSAQLLADHLNAIKAKGFHKLMDNKEGDIDGIAYIDD